MNKTSNKLHLAQDQKDSEKELQAPESAKKLFLYKTGRKKRMRTRTLMLDPIRNRL